MKINLYDLARTGTLIVSVCFLFFGCGGGPGTAKPVTVSGPNQQALASAQAQSDRVLPHETAADSFVVNLAIDETEKLLWDGDNESRELALEILIEEGSRALSSQNMALLLTDPDADFRQTLVDSLTDLGGPQAVLLLQEALYDPHPAVRQAAAEGLEELGVTD